MGQWLEKYRAEKRGASGPSILNVGDRVVYQSPQFNDDDQHVGWKECHGVVEMIDQRNKAFLIQQDETPLWAWVPERFITN